MSSSKKPHLLARRQLLRLLGGFGLCTALLGVLLAGLAAPVVGTGAMATTAVTKSYNDISPNFRVEPPSEQSTILASNGQVLASFYAENRIVVPLDKISPWVQKAVVAVEDKRFYGHHGVDLEGMARAAVNNMVGKSTQGASTLTQQLVKNTLIEEGARTGNDEAIEDAKTQTLARKLREAKYAVTLEKEWSKDQILAGYLNIAPFGPQVYGVETASQHYFSKSAKDLSLAEGALLAGITQSPTDYNPVKHPEAAQHRRDTVLRVMMNQGIISQKEFDQATAVGVDETLKVAAEKPGCAAAGSAAYFCAYVVSEIYNNPVFGKTLADRRALLLRGGLQITTTLDLDKQKAAKEAVEKWVPTNDSSGLNTALASIEPKTGRIMALAQNTNFGVPSAADATATENSFGVDSEHGGGAGFQSGSSFKTMTLASWFIDGHLAYDSAGGTYHYPLSAFKSSCPEQAPPAEANFGNSMGGPPTATTVLMGTQRSLNSTYFGMASQLDLCKIMKLSKSLGAVPGDGTMPEFYPSSILGAQSVPPLSMANAYAALANGGKYCTPIAIEKIVDRNGKAMQVPTTKCHQAIPEQAAWQTLAVLKSTYYSYGGDVNIGRPAATKTGTTDNWTAGWLVGTTPTLSTAVWVGKSSGLQEMSYVNIGGRYYDHVWGSGPPSYIWRDYMRPAAQAYPAADFPSAFIGNPPAPKPTPSDSPSPGDNRPKPKPTSR